MTLSRRSLVTAGAALAAFPLLRPFAARAADPKFATSPFTLGVASGDPGRTRRALDAARARAVRARRRNAGRAGRRATGRSRATRHSSKSRAAARRTRRRSWAHSVHVEVDGLEPARWLLVPLHERRRAQPRRPDAHRARARRARSRSCASRSRRCQNYEYGYYAALRAHGRRGARLRRAPRRLHLRATRRPRVRSHDGARDRTRSTTTAKRYALYKADPDLQAAHAARLDGHVGRPRGRQQLRGRSRRPTTSRASCSSRAAPPRIRPITSTCRCRAACFRAGRISSFIRNTASAGSSIFVCSTDGNSARGTHAGRSRSSSRAPSSTIPRARCSATRRRLGCTARSGTAARGGTCWASRPCSRTSILAVNRICVTPPTAGTATRRRALGSSTFSPSARSRIPSCSPATSTRSS